MAVLNYNELQKNKTGNLKTGKGLSGVHNNTSPSDNDYPGYIDWWGGESPGYHTGTDPSTGGSTIITTGSDGLPNYGGSTGGSWSGSFSGPAYSTETMDQWKQSALNALNNQLNSLLAEYDKQKNPIQQAAQDAARQAYVQYMQSQRALPQSLSAYGQSGGMAESTALGLQTNYGNNVNDILLNKDNQLRDLEFQKNQAKLANQANIANVESEYLMTLANQKFQQQMAQQEFQNQMALLAMQAQLKNQASGGSGGTSGSSSGGSSGSGSASSGSTGGYQGTLQDEAEKYGYQAGSFVNNPGDSRAVRTFKAQLAMSAPYGGNTADAIKSKISTAYQIGEITREEATYLMNYYKVN